jgi:phage portal protein BeeE
MGLFTRKQTEIKAKEVASLGVEGLDAVNRGFSDGIFKAYIPRFLYKPPFGFPRPENIPLLKVFGEYPYLFSVISMLQEEAAGNKWEIVPRDKDVKLEESPELQEKKKEIEAFLHHPNKNKETFSTLIKAAVRDICEVDAGVWVKVFNKKQEMVQLFARDGGAFLKNPDIYGYMGDRADIVFPMSEFNISTMTETEALQRYDLEYRHQAAYFQYGWTTAALPVPFGMNEIVYMMKNPRSDNIYGISPVRVLADIVLTLVYGAQYNLDFYMNSNIPEGILSILGASNDQVKAVKERMADTHRVRDNVTGFMRRVGFRMPVVNTPVEFKPFQLPAREMQILEQQEWFTKIVWMCFGVTADDLGFTENSNKAVSQTMEKRFAKKAVRPILQIIAERVNMDIMPEFETDELEFRFEDYDIQEDITRHSLYEMQIRMGIKTPEMVAEEEQIDLVKLEEGKEKQREQEAEKMNNEMQQNNNFGKKKEEKKEDKSEKKSKDIDPFANTELEEEMLKQINESADEVKKALDQYTKGSLENVQ